MGHKLAVIAGPTASGKSEISLALAKRLDGEIISADSMQVYKGMDIGSAKLMPEKRQGIVHHLIDILEPTEEFNVSVFCKKAHESVKEIQSRGHFPLVCGGTGFYTRAFLYGASFGQGETDPDLRSMLEAMAEEKGLSYMEDHLRQFDPVSADLYHCNKKRIIRAIEYHRLTGLLLSDKNEEESRRAPLYDAAYFVLTMPRDILYRRIDDRVDRMMEEGLVEEVRRLIDSGVTRDMTSMQGLGYRQIYDHLMGSYDLDTAVDMIKQQTRHFAKRQLTWYRKEKNVTWVDLTEYQDDKNAPDKVAEYMQKVING